MKHVADVTQDFFELEFLLSEWYKPFYNGIRYLKETQFIQNRHSHEVPPIEEVELFNNKGRDHEKIMVRTILWMERHIVLSKLPFNIEWSIQNISLKEFENINRIQEHSWHQAFPYAHTITDVARAIETGHVDPFGHVHKIRQIQLSGLKPAFKNRLILITDKKDKPGSVLEGNHRSVAYMLEYRRLKKKDKSMIPTEVLVGYSRGMTKSDWLNRYKKSQ